MKRVAIRTEGEGDVQDLTPAVAEAVRASGVHEGVCVVSAVGSTCAVTTLEYEPGLVEDLGAALERVAPKNARYAHHERWGDYNGHSHIRAALLGPSVVLAIDGGRPVLGTWQQVVFVEFDTRPREREVAIQVVGGPAGPQRSKRNA